MNGAPWSGVVPYSVMARLYNSGVHPIIDFSFKGEDNQFGLRQTTLKYPQDIPVEMFRGHCWRCTFRISSTEV